MSAFITTLIGDKRRWRQYKARVRALPPSYRSTVEALQRYMMYFGSADGANTVLMLEDLVDLFEQAAADGTPIRQIVGENPVEFIDGFLQNYARGGYVYREQQRLVTAINSATRERTTS